MTAEVRTHVDTSGIGSRPHSGTRPGAAARWAVQADPPKRGWREPPPSHQLTTLDSVARRRHRRAPSARRAFCESWSVAEMPDAREDHRCTGGIGGGNDLAV